MPATDLLPGWCAVAQMGHVCHRGHATVDTSLGIPMIRVDLPAVDGDDERLPLEAQVVLVSPGSLYAVTPVTEELCRRARASDRPWRPLALPGIAVQEATADLGIDVGVVRDLARATHELAGILESRRGSPLELDDDLDDDVAPQGCRPPLEDDIDEAVAIDRDGASAPVDVEPESHEEWCNCLVCMPL